MVDLRIIPWPHDKLLSDESFYEDLISDPQIYVRFNREGINKELLRKIFIPDWTRWHTQNVLRIINCVDPNDPTSSKLHKLDDNIGIFPTLQLTDTARVFQRLDNFRSDINNIMFFITTKTATSILYSITVEEPMSSEWQNEWQQEPPYTAPDFIENLNVLLNTPVEGKNPGIISALCRKVTPPGHEYLITPYFTGFIIIASTNIKNMDLTKLKSNLIKALITNSKLANKIALLEKLTGGSKKRKNKKTKKKKTKKKKRKKSKKRKSKKRKRCRP